MTVSPSPTAMSSPAGSTRTVPGTATVLPQQIPVDDLVHVEDVGLLARVELETLAPPGFHAGVNLADVGVVLVGDQSPVLGRPVRVELALTHLPDLSLARPFERPEVFDGAAGVEAVGSDAKQRGAPWV